MYRFVWSNATRLRLFQRNSVLCWIVDRQINTTVHRVQLIQHVFCSKCSYFCDYCAKWYLPTDCLVSCVLNSANNDQPWDSAVHAWKIIRGLAEEGNHPLHLYMFSSHGHNNDNSKWPTATTCWSNRGSPWGLLPGPESSCWWSSKCSNV